MDWSLERASQGEIVLTQVHLEGWSLSRCVCSTTRNVLNVFTDCRMQILNTKLVDRDAI